MSACLTVTIFIQLSLQYLHRNIGLILVFVFTIQIHWLHILNNAVQSVLHLISESYIKQMLYTAYSLCCMLNEMVKYNLPWNILINPTLCIKYYSYYRELCVTFLSVALRPTAGHGLLTLHITVGRTPLDELPNRAGHIVYLP